MRRRWGIAVLLMCVALAAHAAGQRQGRAGGSRGPAQTTARLGVPAHPVDVILGRPTATSVTLSVLWYEDADAFIAYGTQPDTLNARTAARSFRKGEPSEIVLPGLQPNTQYFYEVRSAQTKLGVSTFHTARPPGSTFTFTVTADSHLDDHTDPAVYQRTLAEALADAPDFHIDLGDTFMTGKHATRENATLQYLAQRFFFGALSRSAPLFLVLGNHDGESPRGRGNDNESLAVWANMMRKRYYPDPVPDSFYTGNGTKHPTAGLLQDYYAWEWGDALFVVLDPFWFTREQQGQSDNWARTLGAAQYQWLARTLETSRARFKLIFIHHLVGGADSQNRGGAEAARLYEWGGRNADGSDGFTRNRPGWAMPIHQLLVKTHAAIVFHGHDHIYVKQDLDGIVYQEVPQPGSPGEGPGARSAAEYGYRTGVMLGGSGHMRITVSPDTLTADYVRVSAKQGDQAGRGRPPAHAYTLTAHRLVPYPVVGTGQAKSYDNRSEIAAPKPEQAFYGQDAQHPGPQPSYTLSTDGLTVADANTGLMWQRSPDTDGDGRLTKRDKLTLAQAQARPAALNAARFGGYADWRLPTIKELYSLIVFSGVDPSGPEVDAARLKPFIDTRVFAFAYGNPDEGERVIDSQYASSTKYVGKSFMGSAKLFGVNFADGRIKGYDLQMPGGMEKTFFVLCVRGNPQYGQNDVADNGDGTITDRATGLIWSKADSGTGMNWEAALAWVQAKNAAKYLGHSDWRLPNAKELQSIVDYSRSPDTTQSAAISPLFDCSRITNEAGQPDYAFYWTGTTHASAFAGGAAAYVAFGRAAGWPTGVPGQGGGPGRGGPGRGGPPPGARGAGGPPEGGSQGTGNVTYHYTDVHGAGAQRSDPKAGDPAAFPHGRGPQGDVIRIYNYVRLVRGDVR